MRQEIQDRLNTIRGAALMTPEPHRSAIWKAIDEIELGQFKHGPIADQIYNDLEAITSLCRDTGLDDEARRVQEALEDGVIQVIVEPLGCN